MDTSTGEPASAAVEASAPVPTSSMDVPALLLVQAFVASLAPRVAAIKAHARASIAVLHHGLWSCSFSQPEKMSAQWDGNADLQILCDRRALESMATGAPIHPDRLFLVSGNDELLTRLGEFVGTSGTPLQVRAGGR